MNKVKRYKMSYSFTALDVETTQMDEAVFNGLWCKVSAVEELEAEIKRLRNALIVISHMDVDARDTDEAPRYAQNVLKGK